MPKLIVIINGFNEEALIEDCLKSVRTNLPSAEIAYADGSYQGWVDAIKIEVAKFYQGGRGVIGDGMLKLTTPLSSDSTLDIIKKYGVEHILLPSQIDGLYQPWPSEFAKRNAFFSIGQLGDIYFWLDADERLIGTIDTNEITEPAYNVMLKRDDSVPAYQVMRIFKHVEGIRCEGAHHFIWQGEKLIKKDVTPLYSRASIFHEHHKRNAMDEIRHQAKGAYYRWLIKSEAEQRARHGL